MLDRKETTDSNLNVDRFNELNIIFRSSTFKNREESTSENTATYRNQKIAVVVPAFNEELLIGDALSSIPDFINTIYAVDDCSTDQTMNIIQEYSLIDKRIVPIHHEINGGVGKAITSGFKRAIQDNLDIVVVMAGDNQMDPQYLPNLLDPIIERQCDFTKGNRLKNGFWKGMSAWRLFGNILLTTLNNIASGYWYIKDPQNGYVAISTNALKKINLEHLYPRYAFENDLMIKTNIADIKMLNIDIPAKYGNEQSKIKYLNFIFSTSAFLLKSFIYRISEKSKQSLNPVYPLYFSSLILVFAGIPLVVMNIGVIFALGLILFASACALEAFQQKRSSKG
ncbi:glycosyltransferase involved in cell wall biosynthesis [Methanolinea mesophila]|nr:glycosyltransferase involved in cell wall biosynthesis [Methanolinea mesophila]